MRFYFVFVYHHEKEVIIITIFVFGSNREGRHGRGAALHAVKHYGAKYGQSSGLQGFAYAIVTKELRANYPPVHLNEIAQQIERFINFAKAHPSFTFHVTRIGCGLAGFTESQIKPLFTGAPQNCEFDWGM